MTSILVVDDDDDFRESVLDSLADFNYSCDQSNSANQAILMLKDRHYSLIITDVLMPDQDGLFLVNYLKDKGIDSKIIVMSGGGKLTSDYYLKMAKDFGVDATLKKPFSEDEIISTIRSLEIEP